MGANESRATAAAADQAAAAHPGGDAAANRTVTVEVTPAD